MSEFGFQSFPEMKTIAMFASPDDYEIESEVMNAHQKSSIGNHLIRTYMERDYHLPAKFEDFVYVGLVLQGQGIRRGLEAHRRHRPYCMGSLYWQLNDSWPVVSWSSIDYYGNWKALHYQARRAFAPLHLNPLQQADSLSVYLLSDLTEAQEKLSLTMEVRTFNGKRKGKPVRLTDLSIPANTSQLLCSTPLSPLFQENGLQRGRPPPLLPAAHAENAEGEVLEQAVHFFAESRRNSICPRSRSGMEGEADRRAGELTLQTEQLAKDVFIEVPLQGVRFSDNFFDLLPGERRKVIITSPQIRADEPLPFTVRHLRQTYP